MKQRTLLVLVVLVCGAIFASTAGLPFFSEDFSQLLEKSRLTNVGEALDLQLDPLRPLQHLAYYILSRCAEPNPAWLRALAVLLHAGSVLLVVRLSRSLGLPEREANTAGALFLVFPCVKVLVWGAAITNVLRVFFVLGTLVAFAERRSLLACLAYVLALTSYECAMVVPVLWLLLLLARGERERLREPGLRICALFTAAYVVYLAFFREQRHDVLKPLDSIPTNVVKASLSIAPEPLRTFCFEGLRGHGGAVLIGLGIALYAGWLLLGLLAFARGGPQLRFVLLALMADLVLPVLGAGFVQRYSYFAGAMAAIAVLLACRSWKPRARTALLVFVFLAWSWDSLRDCRDYRAAGALQQRILEQLREERASAGPTRIISVIDLPDMLGSEHDLPFFNWGLEECLRRAGIPGPWVFWRTKAFATGTDVVLLPPGHMSSMHENGVRVLWYRSEDALAARPLRKLAE